MDESTFFATPSPELKSELVEQPDPQSISPEDATPEQRLVSVIHSSEVHHEAAHSTLERIASFESVPEKVATMREDPEFLKSEQVADKAHKQELFGVEGVAGLSTDQFMERVNTVENLQYDGKKAAEAEFRSANPEKAAEYGVQEAARVYTNEQGVADWRQDPAFDQVVRPTDPDYDRLNEAGRLQRLARSNPDKVALYADQFPEFAAIVQEAHEWRSQPMSNYQDEFEARFAVARSMAKERVGDEDLRLRYEQQSERFLPPENEVARQRLEAVGEVFTDYKREHPEAAGLTVYGSMVKGYAKEESDIDGYLFINTDHGSLAQNERPLLTVSRDDAEDGGVGENVYALDKEVLDAYKADFREKVAAATGLSSEKLRNLAIEPISSSLIRHEINDLLPWAKEVVSYKQQLDLLDSDPQGMYKTQPKRPENRQPSQILSALFHLQMDDGLKEYQELLVRELSSQGELGDLIWSEIIKGTEMMEQNLKVGTGKPYPRSLAEAKKAYL